MATSQPPNLQGNSDKIAKASLGAFAFSVLIHSSVILLVGGYVIFEGVVPKASFIPAETSDAALEGEVIPEPEQPSETPEAPALPTTEITVSNSTASEGEATSSDIIVSTGANPSFSLPPAVGLPTSSPKLGFGSGSPGNSENKGAVGPKGNIIRSIFGSSESSPSTLRGSMFDLKQSSSGKPVKADYMDLVRQFSEKQDTRVFRDYYKVDTTLYATHLFIPLISANEAPKAFQVEDKVQPSRWVIVYEGEFTAPESRTYRLAGYADDMLIVCVNGTLVLDGSRPTLGYNSPVPTTDWKVTPDSLLKHKIGNGHLAYGDWMPLEAGRPNRISILFGEQPGGQFCGFLFVQEQGKKYEPDPKGGGRPILPVFRLQDVKIQLPEAKISGTVPAFDERGPVFRNP